MKENIGFIGLALSVVAGTLVLTSCGGSSGSGGSNGTPTPTPVAAACDACGPNHNNVPCPQSSEAAPPTPKPGQLARFVAVPGNELIFSRAEIGDSNGAPFRLAVWNLKARGSQIVRAHLSDGTRTHSIGIGTGPQPFGCYLFYNATVSGLPRSWDDKTITLKMTDSDGTEVLPADPPFTVRIVP
jgi:hypothetical protein